MTVILATGDVGVKRRQPDTMFAGCVDILRQGDIVFGQLETNVTEHGARSPHAKLAMRAPVSMARAVRDAGYGIMSFAGNHCLDWGYEGFFDTLEHMAAVDIPLCGAGKNIGEARDAVVLRDGKLTAAFIACSSILPDGYWATDNRAGCMPLRAHTFYEQIERDQPGTPARVISHPDRQDLESLLATVGKARDAADIVIVSMHWGIHMVEAEIADYQRTVARAVIEHGAHAIVGHHPHILKGIEIYRGAPIFYSLGNFAIEQPHIWDPDIRKTESYRHLMGLNAVRQQGSRYTLPENTRKSGVARLIAGRDGIESVEFVPAWIDDDSVPQVLDEKDSRFHDVCGYLQKISDRVGFDTRIEAVDSYLRITPGRSDASPGVLQ